MEKFIIENAIAVYSILSLTIFILSAYLGYLYRRGKREQALLRLERRRRKEKDLLREVERQEFYEESIRIISLAAIQGQCEVSEAVLRLKKLLDSFPKYQNSEIVKPLQDMYSEIEKFSILADRKSLSKQERFKQDKERFRVEDKFKDSMTNVFQFLYDEFKKVDA